MSLRLRDIRESDKPALVRFHRHLSAETRYRRYHAAKGDLTTSDLRYLTEVDGHQHVALVAELPSEYLEGVASPVADFVGALDPAELAGVVRLVTDPSHPGESEIAIVVRDDVHGRGLGVELIEAAMARGRHEGVTSALAHVQSDNHRALRLFQGLGFRQRSGYGPVVELVRRLDVPLDEQ